MILNQMNKIKIKVKTTPAHYGNAFEQFKAQIDKTNKRNDRYGIPVIQIEELGEEFVDVKERAAGTRFFDDILRHTLPAKKIRKVKFKLVVPELRMDGGWEFIGRVDHEAIGNLIVSVPGSEHGVDRVDGNIVGRALWHSRVSFPKNRSLNYRCSCC